MPVEKAKLPDGREVNTSERFEQGRTFPNKFWNAARFALMNLEGYEPAPGRSRPPCRSRTAGSSAGLAETTADDDRRPRGLPVRRGDPAAPRLHLERLLRLVRRVRQGAAPRPRQRARCPARLAAVLDGLCRLLHPIMPFVTEQVWQALGQAAPRAWACPSPRPAAESVCIAPWPAYPAAWADRDGRADRRTHGRR